MGPVLYAPDGTRIVDSTDNQAEVSTTKGTTHNNILTVTTRNGVQAWLTFLGMAWDAPFDTFLTWRLLVNGGMPLSRFQDSTVQIAAPEQPIQELVPWIQLPQQAIVRFDVDVSSSPASTPANVVCRMKIYYSLLRRD